MEPSEQGHDKGVIEPVGHESVLELEMLSVVAVPTNEVVPGDEGLPLSAPKLLLDSLIELND